MNKLPGFQVGAVSLGLPSSFRLLLEYHGIESLTFCSQIDLLARRTLCVFMPKRTRSNMLTYLPIRFAVSYLTLMVVLANDHPSLLRYNDHSVADTASVPALKCGVVLGRLGVTRKISEIMYIVVRWSI